MGRSKVRGSKKPIPKAPTPTAQPTSTTTTTTGTVPAARVPLAPLDLVPSPSSLIPPSSSVDLNDPNFRTAWQNWTTSALGRLDQLPKLSQSQLNAIAGAAAGMEGSASLGIDLPASLAALFEAKLTLDREKAKLVRMQKELKGYKDAAGQGQGQGQGGAVAAAAATAAAHAHVHALAHAHHAHAHAHGHDHDHDHHDHGHDHSHGHVHSHDHVHVGNGKGKEVMVEEDYGECTCGGQEEYYESDEDCYDCDCDCHGCEHDEEEGEEPPRSSTLSDDPERFDEAVEGLFNWIKAVVWTIEQAAVVAGKRTASVSRGATGGG